MRHFLLDIAAVAALIPVILAPASSLAETAGVQSMARGEYLRGVRELAQAAKDGDVQAQYDLGMAYLEGRGAAADSNQAYKWIKQAAERDLPEAQFELGQLLEEGEGVAKNPAGAADWYSKAAQKGHVGAMYALAELYRQGNGVPQDGALAAKWYRPAADANDIDSQLALGKLNREGAGIPKNNAEAAVWFRKAAQLGSAEGRYLMAMLLLDSEPKTALGHGPSRAVVEAMDWLEDAARQGYAPAQHYLGESYLGAVDAPYSPSRALSWLNLAADQGYAPSLARLGRLYQKGLAVPADAGRAYFYLSLAADQGDDSLSREADELGRQLQPAQLQAVKRRIRDWKDARKL